LRWEGVEVSPDRRVLALLRKWKWLAVGVLFGVAGAIPIAHKIQHSRLFHRKYPLTVANIELLVTFAGLVAAILVPLWVAILQKKWTHADNSAIRGLARNREFMLQRIDNKWTRSVYRVPATANTEFKLFLRVGRSSMLSRGNSELERVTSKNMIKILEGEDGGLLVLGAAGSGKTSVLLQLAGELLRKARADANQPIPVIFLLSSWGKRRLSLRDWLVDELKRSYSVPRRTAIQWVDGNELLPLLDGFDEVQEEYRTECIDAIRNFQQENGMTRFVICSRTTESVSISQELGILIAEIQPLGRRQIARFLDQHFLTGALSSIRADEPLRDLLKTPLGLQIMARASSGSVTSNAGTPLLNRLPDLFGVYVTRMLDQRQGRYSRVQTLRWLTWLAKSMSANNQTEFQIDQLAPDWLPTRKLKWAGIAATAAGTALLIGLGDMAVYSAVYGFSRGVDNGLAIIEFFGLFVMLLHTGPARQAPWSLQKLAIAFIGGLGVGLAFWAEFSPTDGLIGALFFVVGFTAFSDRIRTEPIEELSWAWRRAGLGFWAGAGVGLLIGAIYGRAYHLVSDLASSLGIGIPFAVALGLFGCLASGLAPGLNNKRNYPNEAVHRSARFAIAGAVASMSIMGIVFFVTFDGALEVRHGMGAGVRNALVLGIIVGILMGGLACIRHYALRCLLAYSHLAPLSYIRFLDQAQSQLILRRTGSGYMFMHGLLQDYFSNLQDD
jgi:hypothetical protein